MSGRNNLSSLMTSNTSTTREYFNASYFNQSGTTKPAKYETVLSKPFFNDPDHWQLAINRMRVPLSGIPLTRNNIPFQKWQVGLQYKTSFTSSTSQTVTYVPQYNPKYNQVFTPTVVTKDGHLQVWDALPETQIMSSVPLVGYQSVIKSCFDTVKSLDPAQNVAYGTIYNFQIGMAGTNTIKAYSATNGSLITIINCDSFTMPGEGISNVSNICCNESTGDLYFSYFPKGGVVGTTAYRVVELQRQPNNVWTPSNNFYMLSNYLTSPGSISSMCIVNNMLIVVNVSSIPIYNQIYGFSLQPKSLSATSFNEVSSWIFDYTNRYYSGMQILANNGQVYVYCPNAFDSLDVPIPAYDNALLSFTPAPNEFQYTLWFIGTVGHTLDPINAIMGIDGSNNLLLSDSKDSIFYAYNPTTQSVVYNFTPASSANYPSLITLKLPTEEVTMDSGQYDIFTYQSFLNQINSAFTQCFNSIKSTVPGYSPTVAPSIVYDASTKLFSLVVEGTYSTINNDGSNQYEIWMNETLWRQFYLPATMVNYNSISYKSIMILNTGANTIIGTPDYLTIVQEQSTIYAFYDLIRLIVGTITIPVSGDAEGRSFTTTTLTSNQSISMITDIIPDTTTVSPASIIIYIPQILRWYNLYAQQPFSKIDLILYYETKDGNIYPVQLLDGENWSVKLEFMKGNSSV